MTNETRNSEQRRGTAKVNDKMGLWFSGVGVALLALFFLPLYTCGKQQQHHYRITVATGEKYDCYSRHLFYSHNGSVGPCSGGSIYWPVAVEDLGIAKEGGQR